MESVSTWGSGFSAKALKMCNSRKDRIDKLLVNLILSTFFNLGNSKVFMDEWNWVLDKSMTILTGTFCAQLLIVETNERNTDIIGISVCSESRRG